MADGTGTTTYAYDELDRPTSITGPGTPASKTVGYRYDRDGNRRTLLYPDGTAVTYAFDEAGRLASLVDWASRTTSYRYAPDGLLALATNVNGTTTAQAYDNARRLTDIWHRQGGATIARFTSSGLDAVGNRTQLDETLPGGGGAGGAPSAWGSNTNGQLGDGTATPERALPVAVTGLAAAAAVDAGSLHSLALLPDGTVRAWGRNAGGQLGNGSLTNSSSPVTVLGSGGSGTLGGVAAVAAGGSHSLALASDGTVWAWGANATGQLGAGDLINRSTPVQVKDAAGTGVLTGIVAIAAGRDQSLALAGDGTVWAWGRNDNGQLGDNSTIQRKLPVQVAGPGGVGTLGGVAAIAAGNDHGLALKTDGTVWAWGLNNNGQLGDNTVVRKLAPIQVKDAAGTGVLTGIGVIAGGGLHSLAVTTGGDVWAWGDNGEGQLGDATTTDRKLPVQVKGPGGAGILSGVSAIAGGDLHTVALKSDGTVWAWGRNLEGQLGDNTNTRRTAPVQVEDAAGTGTLAGVTRVSAGGNHGLALAGAAGATSQTTTYAYDRLYRLTGVTAPGGATSYAYDPVGNRTSRVRGSTTASYSYDRADRITQGTEGGTVSYTVNANGNLTGRGGDTFGYDQANRLTAATVGGAASSYTYDGDGKRASSTVGAATTRYAYDPAGLATVLDDGARKYVYGLGLAYATDMAGAVQAVYHADGLGSVRALTDAGGAVVQTYQTDEFGVPTAGGSGQPFGYTGEQRDGETGLVYLRARMYDPTIGRFVQRDPYAGILASPQSLHRYAYVQNNPINVTDPSGLTPYMCQRLPRNAFEALLFRECLQQERERIRQGGGQTMACEPRIGGIATGPVGVVIGPAAPCTQPVMANAGDREREEELENLVYTEGIDILYPHGLGALLEHGWTAAMVRAAVAAGVQAVQREDGRFIYWLQRGDTYKTLVMEGRMIISAVDRASSNIDWLKLTGRWGAP